MPDRSCGVGAVGAVLHIRPGPAGGGSAESYGNAPALNAVEALPCAERAALHMGALRLETDILGRTAESCGKSPIGSRGRRPPMCNTPRTTQKEPAPSGNDPLPRTPLGNPPRRRPPPPRRSRPSRRHRRHPGRERLSRSPSSRRRSAPPSPAAAPRPAPPWRSAARSIPGGYRP
mgnify:CR=1 FL=1